MPTDRPCDKDIVPDGCAGTGGLVSVQLDIIVTAESVRSREVFQDVWHKHAVVFITRGDEIIAGDAELAAAVVYNREQSNKIIADIRNCLTRHFVLYRDRSGSSTLAVDLTQVADCVSDRIAAPNRLGVRPRGIFISHNDRQQHASTSANFADCREYGKQCIEAPEQSFGMGHVIAHAHYRYRYKAGKDIYFFYAVLLPSRRPA